MEKQKFSLTKEIIRQINLQCDLRCFHETFDKETIVNMKWNFTPFQEIKSPDFSKKRNFMVIL